MTVSVATNVSEEVSLQQSQEMIMSIFSCVGYLRDLFPEESFQDHKVAGMSLKSFRRGKDGRSDRLLDWIEKGCFDALSKKYLKQAILTVLSDAPGPNNVLETYTLRVTYPSSNLHQGIDASMSKLSLSRNDQPVLSSLSTSSFSDSMAKILRSLCVMSQTLQPLPQRKYLSMKLVYYEEVTPAGYEPPGFQAADFELEHLFVAPSVKYSFGRAINSNHGIALNMETTLSDKIPSKPSHPLEDSNTIQWNGDNLAESMIVQEKPSKANKIESETAEVALASQTAQAPQSPPAFPLSQAPETETQVKVNAIKTESSHSNPKVKCSCGVNKQAIEMLQCSQCEYWQHTVCVGFISRKDRRLEARPADAPQYSCYECRFGSQPNTFAFLKQLSLVRKAVVLLSARKFENIGKFAELMEIERSEADKIKTILYKEGFLNRSPGWRYYVDKNGGEEVKERIKLYFHQNLSIYPEFIQAQRKDGVIVEVKDKKEVNDPKVKQVNPSAKAETKPPTNPPAKSQPKPKTAPAPSSSTPTPTPIMTKKRQNSNANTSTLNEDFMSQTPLINKAHSNIIPSPAASTTEPAKKKLKMSIPTTNITYD